MIRNVLDRQLALDSAASNLSSEATAQLIISWLTAKGPAFVEAMRVEVDKKKRLAKPAPKAA